jgi:hypothetical protein
MEDINYVQQSDASPQTVMAATLCMMSCTMQSGCWIYINRIADNLNWLAESAELEAELRRLCQRLACHWEAQLAEHRIHDDVAARASNAKRPLFKVNDVETESREARQLASEVIRRAQHC